MGREIRGLDWQNRRGIQWKGWNRKGGDRQKRKVSERIGTAELDWNGGEQSTTEDSATDRQKWKEVELKAAERIGVHWQKWRGTECKGK